MAAREAVAKNFHTDQNPINPKHVFLSQGTYGACYNAIAALANPGDNVLVPRPGFPFYQPICMNLGVDWVHYDLQADKSWEVDLEQLEKSINKKTKAILLNNPSNPCGSCFTKAHME